jgi:hypothetical protein
MWRRARRHPILLSLAVLILLAIGSAAATGWYLLGEARRAGRLVSTVLTSQTGIPLFVDRAATDGAQRLVLYGLRVPPGDHFGGEIRVREVRVDGGLLPIVFPRGRSLSVVAVSPSVTLPQAGGPVAPPDAADFEGLRRLAIALMGWPADFSLAVAGGELGAGDQVFRFDLSGNKRGTGALAARITIHPPRNGPSPSTVGPALALDLTGGETDGTVRLTMRGVAAPLRLGSLWLRSLPAVARLALDAELVVPPRTGSTGAAGSAVEMTGRVEVGGETKDGPLTSHFASRYRADAGQVDLQRLSLDWGGGLRLAGSGRIEGLQSAPRLAVEMAGEAMGARLTGDLGFDNPTGDFTARIQADAVDGRRLLAEARRLLDLDSLGRAAVDVVVRHTTWTVKGTVGSSETRLAVHSTLEGVQARGVFADAALQGSLGLSAVLRRAGTGFELARLQPSTLTISHAGAPLAVVTARSGEASWPLTIEATLPQLSRMPQSPALPGKYTGRVAVTGALDRAGMGVQFAGQLTADLPRAEINLGAPVVLTDARAVVPIRWDTPASTVTPRALPSESTETTATNGRPGSVFVDQVAGYGFTLTRLVGSAEFRDGRLLLPDLGYVHYGGRGSGWLEAAIDGRAVPVRARLEGQRIDLSRLTREYGLTVAEISGIVHYLLVMQYSPAQGVVMVGQVSSADEGGQVSIEVIEKLLASAEVKAETTGVLRQTLENLRVFRYASLSGDVRVTRRGGYLNVSLEGKKRLGIFPAPVQAINLHNVPLGMLARLFARRAGE